MEYRVIALACLITGALAVSACSRTSGGGSTSHAGPSYVIGGSTRTGSTASVPGTTFDRTGYPHPGPGAPATRPSHHSQGDVMLVGLIRGAYRSAPGVELTTATTPSRRFVLQLRRDAVVGEEFVDPRPNGVALVTRTGFPTYERGAHQSCWRRLAPPDARNLVNVPGPFPDNGKVERLASPSDAWRAVIETHSSFWFLASRVTSPAVKDKSFLFLTINPHSHQIQSIRVGQPDPAVTGRLQVKTLPISPTLPMPTPSCTPA